MLWPFAVVVLGLCARGEPHAADPEPTPSRILRSSWASAASAACAGAADGQFVRHSASCAAYYYCHDGGRAEPAACPAPLHFNARRQLCDHAAAVDCTRCSAHGLQNLADPHDRRRYFHCVAGHRLHRTCGAGLLFDAAVGECNVAAVVVGGDYDDDYGDGAIGAMVDHRMCANFSAYDHVQFGDPDDCSRYYVCMRGIGYLERCAANLLFNSYSGYCDRAGSFNFCQKYGPVVLANIDHSHDTSQQLPPQTVPPPSVHQQQPPPQGQLPPPQLPPPQLPPPQLPPPQLPPPTWSNQPPWLPQPAPAPNQHQPAPAPNQQLPAPTPKPQSPPPADQKPTWSGEYICSRPDGKFAVPDSCTSYVQCSNNQQLVPVRTCPDGLYFHSLYQDCNAFRTEQCYKATADDRMCKADSGYFGMPGWCGRYVWCAGGKVTGRFECPTGQYWSVPAGRCGPAKPAYC